MDDDRPMLALSTSRESTISSHDLHDLGARLSPSRPQPSIAGKLDLVAFSKGETPTSPKPSSAIITPHPPVLRDDRPCTNVRYDNPAQVEELARSLWLPRDPLHPCDLGDTIDYHGRALVSSEGGLGVLGSWDEHLTEDEGEEDGVRRQPSQEALVPKLDLKRSASRISLSSTTLRRRPTGKERIRVAGDVAAKIEAEEGVATGRRRGSSGASSLLPPQPSPSTLQRRGTDTSTLRGVGSSAPELSGADPTSGSPPSPTLGRQPLPRQKSSPRIPIFTEEPETLDLPPSDRATDAPSISSSTTAGYFAPPSHPTSPHSTLRRRPSHTDEGPPLSPSSLAPSFASPRSPSTRRNRGRSASAAMSMQPSIAEGIEEGEVYISQADALRNELLEEEREEHEKRVEKEEARARKEKGDKRGGWLTRLLLETAPEEAKPDA